jgi:arylsulfatase A-like enzyme
MWNARRIYDEYIASVDLYLGELLDSFEAQGVFENSYVILTSDHGEMFERGEIAHSTPLLYDPVIHIPLLISAPGQASRQDIHAPTNAVDILPTLASLAGKPIPEWCEGKPLPGKGNLKLMYYTGYEADESFELYDLDQDAEELQDLYPDNPSEAKRMKDELLDALDRANQPYAR